MATDPPPASASPPWVTHLERAHTHAHRAAELIGEELAPSAHLGPAARRIERGLVALYDAFDGRTDRPTALDLAHTRLWEGAILAARAGLLGAVEALRDACRALLTAQACLPRAPHVARAATPLRASQGLPPLHVVERASCAPVLRAPAELIGEELAPPAPAPPELPEPTTFEELAALAEAMQRLAEERLAEAVKPPPPPAKRAQPDKPRPPPGFAFAPPPATSADAFVRGWARECIDEIGMLGVQRAPQRGDDWRACRALEDRLLAVLDALAALGPTALAFVEPHIADAPVADPLKTFAAAMIAGCFEGRDLLGAAERLLRRGGPGDPALAAAFASALKLAPNPFVPGALRPRLASTDPASRALAVEIMAHRGWLTEEDLAALADDEDPRVLALALPALAASRDRNLERALSRALAHADLGVQSAALDAMALVAHPRAAEAARQAACGALGDAALVPLALVGDEADARWLLARMDAAPSEAAIEAAGWAGLVEAAPRLIKLLEASEDDAEKLAAGAALDRLLGAGMVDLIEVMAEEIAPRELPDPDPEPHTFAMRESDPRDPPPAPSAERLEVASIDPARWRGWWGEHGRKLDPKQRTRRGQGYSPSVSLYELDRLALPAEDRRRLHRELCARTGRVVRFDPGDFVVAQEEGLKAWEGVVRASGVRGWGRGRR
jgi:hypothetical protein